MKKIYTIKCLCLLSIITTLITTKAFSQVESISDVPTNSESHVSENIYRSTPSNKSEFKTFLFDKINATNRQKKSISPILASIAKKDFEQIDKKDVNTIQRVLNKKQTDLFLFYLQLEKQNLLSLTHDSRIGFIVKR